MDNELSYGLKLMFVLCDELKVIYKWWNFVM